MPEHAHDLTLTFPGGTVGAMATVENCERLWELLPIALRSQLAVARYTSESFGGAVLRAWRAAATPEGGPVHLEALTRATGLYLVTQPSATGARREVPLALVDLFLVCGPLALAVRLPGHIEQANLWGMLDAGSRAALFALGVSSGAFNRAIVSRWLELATHAESNGIPVLRVVADREGMRIAEGTAADLCGRSFNQSSGAA